MVTVTLTLHGDNFGGDRGYPPSVGQADTDKKREEFNESDDGYQNGEQ